jgi:iron complex outermembrane recepter protein
MSSAARIEHSHDCPVPRFVHPYTITMHVACRCVSVPRLSWFSLLLCLVSLASIARAQIVGNSPTPDSPTEDPKKAAASEVVELTPFTVTSTKDRGYQAQSSLGGSRLRTDLKDVASPTSAFTAEFFNDVGISNTDDLARYMLSTEYDFGENAGPGQNFLASNSTRQLRMRGLSGGTVAVNFFKSDFPADTFSTERIDQSRGPNSVLFGIGSPGGIINVTNKRALLGKNTGSVAVQGRSEGGLREEFDYNQAIGNHVALRFAAMKEQRESWRNYEFNDSERSYLTGKWRVGQKTEFNFDLERADITKQTQRSATAYDGYTRWVAAGRNVGAANAALQISGVAANNTPYLVLDTASGTLTNWINKTRSTLWTAIDGENVPISDFKLLPKETAVYGPGYELSTKYDRLGAYLTHTFTSNLNLEIAGMRTDSHNAYFDSQAVTTRAIYADTNPTLPSGAANPNVGKAYLEALPLLVANDTRSDSVRAVLSYTRDFGRWGRHTLAGVYQYDFSKISQMAYREQIISPNAPTLSSAVNNNNRVFRRTYVDLTGPSRNIVMAPYNQQALGTITETLSGRSYTTALVPFNANNVLNSFNDKTKIGMLQSSFWKNRIKTIIGTSRDDRNDYAANTIVTPVAGFTSGIPIPVRSQTPIPTVATSVSFSGVFQATDWLGLTYSQAGNSGLPSLNGKLNTTSTDLTSFNRPPIPKGRSKDVGFKLDLFQNRFFLTAQYFQTSAERDFDFGNISPTINPIWDALALVGKVPSGTAASSSGRTFDSRTQGYEVELTANPSEHWRIFLNYTKSQSAQSKLGQEDFAYIAFWRPTWEANQALPLATGAGTIGTQLAALDARTLSFYTLAENKPQLGQMRHKLNLVSNYEFSNGTLKGFTFGGGVRYLGRPINGYSATGTPGAIVSVVTYGSEQVFLDLNAAYRRQLRLMGKSVTWSLQTNINNALNNDAFIRVNTARDGVLTAYRFNPPLEWLITTKLNF